jgi:two-component system cell cycle response regulator
MSAPPVIDVNDTGTTSVMIEPCRVLVVDDDPLTRTQLASLLKLADYEVHTAGSGTEALAMLNETRYQIVLTDWEMPGLDGLALCRSLRARDAEFYTYVLMLTVRNDKRDTLAGLGAGADDYIVKGASAEELLARVEVGRRITRLEHSLRFSSEENRRLAVTDPLTGARNRRFLMKYLPRELERARRYDRPLAILSCDIDGFKRINDRYGHEAGDQVLQAFVARSLGCMREAIDWIARAGGEEFVIVLPETQLRGASRVAEKLRHGLASHAIPTTAGPLGVTVSIGVTALETRHELANMSVAELLRAADQCLYVSKNLGRDRTTSVPAVRVASVMTAALAGTKHEVN